MTGFLLQLLHLLAVPALAPGLTGLVRLVKARLTGKRGAPLWQPYLDLLRLLRKDAVVADGASWLFRVTPYLVFTAIWLGVALVPAFTSDLLLAPTADLIALVALLGSARFFMALAGLDVGTSFGGIGSSREMMIASLAEPAMLMVIFTVSLLVHSTSLAQVSQFLSEPGVGLRVSLGLGLIAIVMVAIAENARVPVDNPATHLELTMVHEAMILEYSGRHLALMEAAAMLKLLLYVSLIGCIFFPWGMAHAGGSAAALALGAAAYVAKIALGGVLLGLFETSIAKMRVFRVSEFLAAALLLAILATILLYVSTRLFL
jgi:formate hydrogenlyase subunit 4